MDSAHRVLPATALTALLEAVMPQPPGAEVAARIMRRVRARLDDGSSIVTVRRDAGWKSFFPGAERKVLFDDGATLSWLLRLGPGVKLPKHEHDAGPEECLVLEGDMWHEGECYRPGDYIVARQGSTHQETQTDNGAVLFFRTPSPKAARVSA